MESAVVDEESVVVDDVESAVDDVESAVESAVESIVVVTEQLYLDDIKKEEPKKEKPMYDDVNFFNLLLKYETKILVIGDQERYDDFLCNGFPNVLFRSNINVDDLQDIEVIFIKKE